MAIVGAIGSIVGGKMGGDASTAASQAQISSAQDANKTQWAALQQQRADNAPYRDAGAVSLAQLMKGMGFNVTDHGYKPENYGVDGVTTSEKAPENMGGTMRTVDKVLGTEKTLGSFGGLFSGRIADPLGFFDAAPDIQHWTPNVEVSPQRYSFDTGSGVGDLNRKFTLADFEQDPGYQFRLNEGTKALQASAAARGGLNSGATLKALTRYGQDYGSNEYEKSYNRYNSDQTNRFNRLATLAGIGQTANASNSQSNQNYANNVSQNQMAAGNAQAAGTVGRANAINNGLSSVVNYYNNQNLLKSLGNNNTPVQTWSEDITNNG